MAERYQTWVLASDETRRQLQAFRGHLQARLSQVAPTTSREPLTIGNMRKWRRLGRTIAADHGNLLKTRQMQVCPASFMRLFALLPTLRKSTEPRRAKNLHVVASCAATAIARGQVPNPCRQRAEDDFPSIHQAGRGGFGGW